MNLNAITLAITRPGGVRSWDPLAMFTSGVQGVWYDPSDINLTWRRNLLTYSEQFDNAAWFKNNWSVSTNSSVAPDGSMTADKMVENTVNGFHATYYTQSLGTVTGTYSYSVYLKNAGRSWANIRFNGVSTWFDITNGAIGTIGSGVTASISSAGNGWYRCTVSAVVMSVSISPEVIMTTGDLAGVYTGDGASGIYIWGAQLELGSTATPYQRITDGVQDYLQYQAQPVLYQNAAGTTPVTAVEQPVGLMLDKSKGLVLGSNISQVASATYTTYQDTTLAVGLSVTKNYLITFSYSLSSGSLSLQGDFLQSPYSSVSGNGTYSAVVRGGTFINIHAGPATGTATNISVRELPGNHAFNSSGNSANFPVLSARYNLLTETEFRNGLSDLNLSGGLISSTTLAGYLGAIAFGKDGSTTTVAYKNFTHTSGVSYTLSVIVQMTDGLPPAFSGSVSSSSNPFVLVGNGQTSSNTAEYVVSNISGSLYRVSWTYVASGNVGNTGVLAYATNNNRTFKVTAYDLRVANDALNQPAYQRVNTATDYDTAGFKPYLKFNGTNQWLRTNSIDFSYGDKMFVCAGVRKLSDSAAAVPFELSVNGDSNAGTFQVNAPSGIGSNNIVWFSYGTSKVGAAASGIVSPVSSVMSGIGSISGPESTIRINGVQITKSTASQGTGNYGNYPLYIGARAGTSLWFNGRLHQLVVAGKQASASEITNTETFINQKTGAY